MNKLSFRQSSISAIIAIVVFPSFAYACPMCKMGLMSAINPRYITKLAEGYFWSIILMLSVPFLLVATMILLVRRSVKSQNPKHS